MRNAIVTVALAFFLACAALPAILTGVSAAAEIIDTFDHLLSPQYQEAQQQCAAHIQALPDGTVTFTEITAACAELTDAWYQLQPLVDQLRPATREGEPDPAIVAEADKRVQEFRAIYKRYQAADLMARRERGLPCSAAHSP